MKAATDGCSWRRPVDAQAKHVLTSISATYIRIFDGGPSAHAKFRGGKLAKQGFQFNLGEREQLDGESTLTREASSEAKFARRIFMPV